MLIGQLTQRANALQCAFIPYMTAQRVARVSGVNHYTAIRDTFHNLTDESLLGVIRVYRQYSGQLYILPSPGTYEIVNYKTKRLEKSRGTRRLEII